MDPITYPTIEVPGKGVYVVKFTLGAQYALEEMGIGPMELAAEFGKWHAAAVASVNGTAQRVAISPMFLVKVLAACIQNQVTITPRELADCFQPKDVTQVAKVVMDAFAKTEWSAVESAPTPATPIREQKETAA